MSSEGPDGLDYISYRWTYGTPFGIPPLGQDWIATACGQTFTSIISQVVADLEALIAAAQCAFTNAYPNASSVFYNTAQFASVPCPGDANAVSSYEVQAGVFPGINQAAANQLAYDSAYELARANLLCIQFAPTLPCPNQPYSATATLTGASLGSNPNVTWTVPVGTLPAGLTWTSSGDTFTVSGTPTVYGQFTFSIGASLGNGQSASYNVTLNIPFITSTLPNGTVGQEYFDGDPVQLVSVPFPNPFYEIDPATPLPDGLTLDDEGAGLISGTPTAAFSGTINFRIFESPDATDYCEQGLSLTVGNTGPQWQNMVWTNIGGGSPAPAIYTPAIGGMSATGEMQVNSGSQTTWANYYTGIIYYNGPATNCHLHGTIAAASLTGILRLDIGVHQAANFLAVISASNQGLGTFDIYFTVPDTGGQTIEHVLQLASVFSGAPPGDVTILTGLVENV